MILRFFVEIDTKDERNKGLTIGALMHIEQDIQQAIYERGGYVKSAGMERMEVEK